MASRNELLNFASNVDINAWEGRISCDSARLRGKILITQANSKVVGQ
jgi:hypothetical protein